MGNWGRLSFELSEALQYYHLPQALQMLCMPVLKALRFVDTCTALSATATGCWYSAKSSSQETKVIMKAISIGYHDIVDERQRPPERWLTPLRTV
jgi:hypothetical protein